eukprot:c38986_g1_i1.p1 GENE.c38986_g1_i1~~c38986_g1_i1.p1  ORF type:complete len:932 (+),score=146.15 c38986_g1_i1:40-2796(+)
MNDAPPLPAGIQVKTLVALNDTYADKEPIASTRSQPRPLSATRSSTRPISGQAKQAPSSTADRAHSERSQSVDPALKQPRRAAPNAPPSRTKARHSIGDRRSLKPLIQERKSHDRSDDESSEGSKDDTIYVMRESRRSVGSVLSTRPTSMSTSTRIPSIRAPTATPLAGPNHASSHKPTAATLNAQRHDVTLRRRPEFAGQVNDKGQFDRTRRSATTRATPQPPSHKPNTPTPKPSRVGSGHLHVPLKSPSRSARALNNNHSSEEPPDSVAPSPSQQDARLKQRVARLSLGLGRVAKPPSNTSTGPRNPSTSSRNTVVPPSPTAPGSSKRNLLKSVIAKGTRAMERPISRSQTMSRPTSSRVTPTPFPASVVRQSSARLSATTSAPRGSHLTSVSDFDISPQHQPPSTSHRAAPAHQLVSQSSGLSSESSGSAGSSARHRNRRNTAPLRLDSLPLLNQRSDSHGGSSHNSQPALDDAEGEMPEEWPHPAVTVEDMNEEEEASDDEHHGVGGRELSRVVPPDDLETLEDPHVYSEEEPPHSPGRYEVQSTASGADLESSPNIALLAPTVGESDDSRPYVPKPLSPGSTMIDPTKPVPTKLNHQEPDTARQGNDYDYFLSTVRHTQQRKYFDQEAADIEDLYQLQQEIGNGGYSKVWAAREKASGEVRAVKLVEVSTYAQHRTRMEAEAAVLGSVSHPAIVKFYGIVRTPKYFCFVMELLNGGELFDKIIEQKNGYPEPEACRLITTILEAVEHLHMRGVVHRDIKPENFLFDFQHNPEGSLKLIDFGFATFQNPHADMLGSSCGTPDYIAPELLLEHPHNQAVDMWSVGVVLYILLCGFPPFYAETDEKLFDLIAEGQYDFPSPHWDGVSTDAKALVEWLLQVEPSKRWTATQALGHPWIIRNNLLNAHKMLSKRMAKK